MSEQGRGSVTRRAFARLLVSGAAGLSLFAGCRHKPVAQTTCYEPGPPPGPPVDGTAMQRWAYLGDVWRRMTSHWKDPREMTGDGDGNANFDVLRNEMLRALDLVSASPELRAVFAERWYHINRSHYSMATCYKMMAGGMPAARGIVEEQVAELEQLVDEGKLTEEAGRKSAEVLGVQVEFMGRYHEAAGRLKGQEHWDAVAPVVREYDAGKTVAAEEAELAGERLVEMMADKLEWLAGPVPEGVGNTEGKTDE